MDSGREQGYQALRETCYIAIILLIAYFFFFWRLGSPALYDLDEGGYAEIAREILVLKDWIIPHLNFVRLLDKPPLLYWLTAISYKIFGLSEFTARLPVALTTFGCMALCYLLGRRLFGSLAGLLSALIFATSAGTFIFGFGRQLLPDMPFTLFLTAAFSALLMGYLEPAKRRRYFLLGYTAMALAVMTKGLIGLVFPCLAVVGYILLTREFSLIKQLHLFKGTLLFLILVLPWPLVVELKSEGFLRFYLLDVHILRFFHQGMIASFGASLPLPYFWAVTALWLYPWIVFLPLAFWWNFPFSLQRLRDIDKATLWLWLWGGSVLIFFSISAFRLDIYGLPALPAFAILIGRFWAEAFNPREGTKSRRGTLVALSVVVFIAGAMLLTPLVPAQLRQHLSRELYGMVDTDFRGYYQGITSDAKVVALPSWEELSSLWILGGSVLLGGSFLAFLAAISRRLSWSFALMVITMIPIAYCTQIGLSIFEPCKASKSLAAIIVSTIKPGEKIVKDGRYEEIATVTFYTGQRIYLVHGKRDDLLFGSYYPEAANTFLGEKEFFQLWNSGPRVYLLTDYPANRKQERKLFYSSLELHTLGHSGNIYLFSNRPQ